MGIRLSRALFALACVFSGWCPKAGAYEYDVHFYHTYAMARYAGLKHEVAAAIGLSAQRPDETTFLASAFYEFKIGRIFHFPCSRGGVSVQGNRITPGLDDKLVPYSL